MSTSRERMSSVILLQGSHSSAQNGLTPLPSPRLDLLNEQRFGRAMNPVVRSDIVVMDFLNSVGGYRHKSRRDRLLDILDVDLDWHMHAISDGERRRVQLCMGLMSDWDVLLLDEVGAVVLKRLLYIQSTNIQPCDHRLPWTWMFSYEMNS